MNETHVSKTAFGHLHVDAMAFTEFHCITQTNEQTRITQFFLELFINLLKDRRHRVEQHCRTSLNEGLSLYLLSAYECNFDKSMCSFVQDRNNDIFDWTRINGSTPSFGTGPSADHAGNGMIKAFSYN